jgi:hypothetical protein
VAPVPRPRATVAARSLAVPLLVLWGTATTLLFGMLLHGILMQRRDRRPWGRIAVDGMPVLVAPDAGPAVMGVWHLQIVLPKWALSSDPAARRLMLQHEEQHLRARDPNLLQLAATFLVLMPWNVALWWLARRLRLAVEVDCDRRVLRVGGDAHAYGKLLIDVGARYAAPVLLPGAAFSESTSHLERRIEAMTQPSPRRPLATAIAFGAVATSSVVLACVAPRPQPIRPAVTADRIFSPIEVRRPRRAPPVQPYTREQMTERGTSAAPSYPWRWIENGRNEDVGAGYYGPAPVRVEVMWLKPDSLRGESGPLSGLVLTRVESTGPYPDTLGPRLEQQAREAFSTRVSLMSGLRTDDTAYMWFVLSSSGAVVRAGRAPSSATMRREVHLPSPGAYFTRSYAKGEIAAWVVVIAAAWEKP